MAKHHWQVERELMRKNRSPSSGAHSRRNTAYVTNIASPDIVHDAPLTSTGSLAALARRAEASGMKIVEVITQESDDE